MLGMARTNQMGDIGHLKFLWHSESGVIENRFLKEYGNVVRIKGPFLVRQISFRAVIDPDGRKGGPTLVRRSQGVASHPTSHKLPLRETFDSSGDCFPGHRQRFALGGWYVRSPLTSRHELIQCLGETHRRQRKGMMPAFGLTASRELLPRFVEVLDKVSAFLWIFAP